jgi:hypothetical protein
MSSADAAERARDAARARWSPSPVVSRAVDTVVQRSAELSPEQLAELAEAIGAEDDGE